MRPLFGVILELAALGVVLSIASSLTSLHPYSILILLLAQLLTTVLVHCPAHYLVGRALGIRFKRLGLGRSTAAKALPSSLRRMSSFLVVFTLSLDPASRRTVAPKRMRVMFLAGVTASVGDAIAFALAITITGDFAAAVVLWLFAIGYLLSDLKFSPVSGDVMRARTAATSHP